MPDLPTKPWRGRGAARSAAGTADVAAGVTAAELIDRYHRHLAPLHAARPHPRSTGPDSMGQDSAGPDSPAPWLVAHALAALTTAEAIVDDLRRERWALVVDALRHGASVDEVGAAMAGLDAQEVRIGLTSWADQLRRQRALTDAQHAAVVALVAPGRSG